MNWTDFFNSLIGGNTGKLLGTIGEAAVTQAGIQDVGEAQKEAIKALTGQTTIPQIEDGLLGQALEQTKFKPFTVTSGTGGTAQVGPTGGLTLGLSAQEQAAQQGLLGMIPTLLGQVGRQDDVGLINMLTQSPEQRQAREQAIFSRLQAAQLPEQERARLGLEERLASQGRLGVRTSMFGGTPEQLALEKAIQEQQAQTSVSAMEQARAEQALQSQQTLAGLQQMLGEQQLLTQTIPSFLQAAYTPQAGLLGALAPATDLSRVLASLQAGGAELYSGLGQTAIESQLGFESLKNALRQQQYQGLFDLLKGDQQQQQATSAQDAASLFSKLLQQGVNVSWEQVKSLFG
jgi:hypothetical protein